MHVTRTKQAETIAPDRGEEMRVKVYFFISSEQNGWTDGPAALPANPVRILPSLPHQRTRPLADARLALATYIHCMARRPP